MTLKNRSRDVRSDRPGDSALDGLCLPPVGDATDNVLRFEDLPARHGDRPSGHFVEAAKPAFAKLLLSAGIVQFHEQVRLFGIEISGRVIEGQVAILAD